MKLVTGGAGYLGSHLAKELLSKGEKVRIYDLKKTKYVPEEVEFVQGDMRDYESVRSSVESVDTVFHLAFVQSHSKMAENVSRDINIRGTENFLKASVEAGVSRFVYTSTIEIYGTRPPYPCSEDAPKDNPVGWYGKQKLEAENLVWRYYKEKGLLSSALRMPTICGPGYYNHRAMLQLMDRIIDGKLLATIGKGNIYGDFVYYKDILQAYILCAEKEEAVGEPFNISCEKSATHYELVKAMIDAVGSKSKIIHLSPAIVRLLLPVLGGLKIIDVPKYQYDYLFNHNVYAIDKAKRLLGYTPTKSASESAAELIKGYIADREFVKKRSQSY